MSECPLDTSKQTNGTCLDSEHAELIAKHTGKDVSALAKECSFDTMCVIKNSGLSSNEMAVMERETTKVPTTRIDHDYWLNNTEIDTVMSQLRRMFPGFAHGFIHMSDLVSFPPVNAKTFDYSVFPVTEIDFAKELESALAKRGIIEASSEPGFKSKLSTFSDTPVCSYGVVFNTDTSKGGGQHWFCVYLSTDQRDGAGRPAVRIELFNSAGGGCSSSKFNEFWTRIAHEIAKRTGLECTFNNVTSLQHQSSETGNCGSYSLFYIYSRLSGATPREFDRPDRKISDGNMLAFRRRCFRVE